MVLVVSHCFINHSDLLVSQRLLSVGLCYNCRWAWGFCLVFKNMHHTQRKGTSEGVQLEWRTEKTQLSFFNRSMKYIDIYSFFPRLGQTKNQIRIISIVVALHHPDGLICWRSFSEGGCSCLTHCWSASHRYQKTGAGPWTRWSWKTCTGKSRWGDPGGSLGRTGKACFPSAEKRKA